MISLQERQKLPTTTLDEIHTGSLWEQTRQKYCGYGPDAFPLALVCFYDKTNTDVFGALSCAPFICTLSFLNKDSCNDDSNYIVLGYPQSWIWKRKSKKMDS
jgi:hypothetical protein